MSDEEREAISGDTYIPEVLKIAKSISEETTRREIQVTVDAVAFLALANLPEMKEKPTYIMNFPGSGPLTDEQVKYLALSTSKYRLEGYDASYKCGDTYVSLIHPILKPRKISILHLLRHFQIPENRYPQSLEITVFESSNQEISPPKDIAGIATIEVEIDPNAKAKLDAHVQAASVVITPLPFEKSYVYPTNPAVQLNNATKSVFKGPW